MKFFYYKIQRFLYRCPALQIDGILLENLILPVIDRNLLWVQPLRYFLVFYIAGIATTRASHPVA